MPKRIQANGTIKIDKNIPVPAGRNSNQKYPYRQMQVGDSFIFGDGVSMPAASSGASQAGRRMNMKFTVRRTEQGIRCWRIA